MRLLYACTHPTLRTSDIESLVEAGFEVVPSFVHIQFRGHYRIDPRKCDSPSLPINIFWRRHCTVPELDLVKIQKVDFYRVSDEPYTAAQGIEPRVELRNFSLSGEVSKEDAELINQYFDVIVVQSFPNLVPAVLKWFKGIVVFRIFGSEDPNFSFWDWYKSELYSVHSDLFFLEKKRYCSLSVFSGILDVEKGELLGKEPGVLNSVVFETIKQGVGNLTWASEESSPMIATNISYLDISHSWQSYYEEFRKNFNSLPYHVYGKNNVDADYCRGDLRIQREIPEYSDYLSRYCNYRVFCSVGRLKQHSQYTPFECAAMGIPILFLSASALAHEFRKIFGGSLSVDVGLCRDLHEMSQVAERCLANVEFAKNIAQKQRILFEKCFGKDMASQQALSFYRKCEGILELISKKNEAEKFLNDPDEKRSKRMLWAFYHKTNRREELPLWREAGFEVIPIKMPSHLSGYQGAEYDNESDPLYPEWRKYCSMPSEAVEYIRDIDLIKKDSRLSGEISKEEINWLNNHIGYIYAPASVDLVLNLLKNGYRGIILHRYFGYYHEGVTLTKLSKNSPYFLLRMYPNYIWMPSLKSIGAGESPSIARSSATVYLPSLYRNPEYFFSYSWQGEKSRAEIAVCISDVQSELKHYYANFITYMGHLPYKIYGKNGDKGSSEGKVTDSFIVGTISREDMFYTELSKSRVFVETGLVSTHCHYAPLEALCMGIPVVFCESSGFAIELSTRVPRETLYGAGMCSDWNHMALVAQKCLSDVTFAKRLSAKQVCLREFVTKAEMVEVMINVQRKGDLILSHPPLPAWTYCFRAKLIVLSRAGIKVCSRGKSILYNVRSAKANFIKKMLLVKKITIISLIIIGVLPDKGNYKKKIKKFLDNF